MIAITSPNDAASGVAILSGFILNLCENKMSATSKKPIDSTKKKEFCLEK